MIKTVFIDLDDTILDFHRAEAEALRETLIELKVEPKPEIIERYSIINAGMWKLFEEGKINREQVLIWRFDIFFAELEIERSGIQAKNLYEERLGKGHFFVPGAQELLEELSAGYHLYLASNGTAAVQEGRIKSAGIAPFFQDIFISELIGFHKPQKEFFDFCFRKIPDFSEARTIIIGDSLTSDIKGGNAAGIYTCWFNPSGKPKEEDIPTDYEVRTLGEIPGLLKNL